MKNKIPAVNGDFTLEEIDGELLLYSPSSTTSIYLNPSASTIWQLIDGNCTVGDIIGALEASFPISKSQIEHDVITALNEFADSKIITLN